MKKIVKKRQLFNKKLVLNIILVLFMFLSIGYSTLSTSLNINGNLNVKKYYEPTLYNVLKKETETGELARKYTGEHKDSFTEEPSQDIYYWYAANDSQGTQVLDKNNVLFAGQCFQMIRTTDTGGVKMIYNGEADDGKCLNTRGTHVGYAARTLQDLATNYWYGTDYTYDSTNKVFTISGVTEHTNWSMEYPPNLYDVDLIGKYTCLLTSENGTCSTLYLIESYNNTSSAYVIPINSNSHYSQFGTLQFNAIYTSPAHVGYMYGDVYPYGSTNSTNGQGFTSLQTVLSSTSLGTSYWYANSISYDSTTGKYSLVDPYQVAGTTDYPNLVGKYTFRSETQTYTNSSVYYIAGVNNTTMYYKQLQNGNLLSAYEIVFGESITDNGDNTYTINNPTNVTLSDLYNNYENYKNKYTCNDSNATCANPRYITGTTSKDYTYITASSKIMIGKTRNGLVLTDTILVRKDELVINPSNYSNYKYTCNTENSTCTEETLRMIASITTTGYHYAANRYFGSSVTWDGTNYTLVDPIEIENYNNLNSLSTHHYMCVSNGLKTCSTVAYIFNYGGSGKINYITLKNGKSSATMALEDMLTKNTTNSTMKSGIDAWYKHYMLPYDQYLEDTIFCNDRSIITLGSWNPDGGMTNAELRFKEYNITSDLNCINTTDQFSISNNNAKLTYKVGLMSSPEMRILNNNIIRKTELTYWLGSPYFFSWSTGYPYSANRPVGPSGSIGYHNVFRDNGVRPSISLKPGTRYTSGTGSMADPYIVDTSNS